MDLEKVLWAAISMIVSAIFFLVAQKMPSPNKDEFLSKPRVYWAAIMSLLIGIIFLFKSFNPS